MRLLVALLVSTLVLDCAARPWELDHIAKSGIDLVADAHRQETQHLLEELSLKLYRRNPRELAKTPGMTASRRMRQLFDPEHDLDRAAFQDRRGADLLNLCFDEQFSGDRVFALLVGLDDMLDSAYNHKDEFYILDRLDQQKLYNSARNIEILVWRLSNTTDNRGELFILTNSLPGEPANLSFERLFGKLIAIQDMMARIMEDRTNRTINKMVHTAGTSFLPVGL
jgi:hypothetical protein